MKILVTGGAGYIGSNLADRLLEEGHQVWVVDDLSQGKLGNIAAQIGSERFHFVQGTVLDEDLMPRLIDQVDVIYHLAAIVGVKHIVDNPLKGIVTNVHGTELVLRLAYERGKRVVIASSSEIYGKSDRVPLSEEDDLILGPTSVERWSYSSSKAIDEYVALAYAKAGMRVSIVRYFNSYGPRLDPRGYGSVIARFITQAMDGRPITVYDDGLQTRSFTYVTDTVEGTYLAGTRPEALGRCFNIANGRETSIRELAYMVKAVVGSASEIVFVPYEQAFGDNFEETRRRVPDVQRAQELLGFRAEVALEDGLWRTVAWFRRNAA